MNKSRTLIAQFAFCMALAGILFSAGCAMWGSRPDPLEGWRMCRSQDPRDLDRAISDDYQDYVRHLPSRERNYVGPIELFEDGTGQHAVKIEIALNGTWLEHLLIYNSQNERVRAITYKHGHYAS